ncbi:FKBP-type peptidyl-prolyl cis-trans isomerase [Mariniphaga sp.]|uniref:FKBP-type peptidyl-prolyl cis-trans isomerase n=1 Tax=Mariniphaga sp. TaxID=1954475 RepID=UPI0035677B11
MKRIITLFLLAVVASAFFSCKENSLEKQRQNELKKLDEFIRAHYAEVDRKPSGLYYIELEEGTGDSIKMGDQVQVFYEIQTLDSLGTIGTGNYEPLQLTVLPPTELPSTATYVNELKALHEALTYMKKGSKARLIFDSQLGFGQYGSYGFSGFTPLMMEVEVYKVYPAEVPEEEITE